MKKITEKNLLNLGFEKNVITPEEAGEDHGYTYFTLDVAGITLMSNSDDACEDGKYYTIEIFDTFNENEIKNLEHLKTLVDILLVIERKD